jgi:hypothetical protein
VMNAANPGYGALNAKTEATVRDAAKIAQIYIPLICTFWQVVIVNALE